MSEIYTRCSSVIVWLNGSRHLSQLACYWTIENHLGTLIRIPGHLYFQRLWIVQETILARHVRVLVQGGYWLSWDSICAVLPDVRQKDKCSIDDLAGLYPTLCPKAPWVFSRSSSNACPGPSPNSTTCSSVLRDGVETVVASHMTTSLVSWVSFPVISAWL